MSVSKFIAGGVGVYRVLAQVICIGWLSRVMDLLCSVIIGLTFPLTCVDLIAYGMTPFIIRATSGLCPVDRSYD